jgi:cysteine synthase
MLWPFDRAETRTFKSGDTIVKASSGNASNALSMATVVKGYKMLQNK